MPTHCVTLDVGTSRSEEMIDLTRRVRQAVKASGVQDGICLVFCTHTTAAITLNENSDPDVQHDLLAALAHAVPKGAPFFRHAEGNSHAHARASMVGVSRAIPVQGGKLLLGTWQAIYLCEFDGPRNRNVVVAVQG